MRHLLLTLLLLALIRLTLALLTLGALVLVHDGHLHRDGRKRDAGEITIRCQESGVGKQVS